MFIMMAIEMVLMMIMVQDVLDCVHDVVTLTDDDDGQDQPLSKFYTKSSRADLQLNLCLTLTRSGVGWGWVGMGMGMGQKILEKIGMKTMWKTTCEWWASNLGDKAC